MMILLFLIFALLFFASPILLAIGLLFPKVPSVLLKRQLNRKQIGLIFTTTTILFFILTLQAGYRMPQNSPTEQSNQNETQTTPTPTIPLTPKGKLQTIANDILKDDGNIKVDYDETGKLATLSYGDEKTFWDEKSMVEGLITTYVKTGLRVFNIPEINEYQVTVRSKFTDQYGKEQVENAARISMTRDEFQKYNWSGLNYQPIYYTLKSNAEIFFIHPAILKKIALDELTLNYK